MTSSTPAHPSYLASKSRRLALKLLTAGLLVFGGYAIARGLLERRLDAVVRALDDREPGWRLDDLQRQRAPVHDSDNAGLIVQALAERLPNRFMQHFYVQTSRRGTGPGTDFGAAVKTLPNLAPPDRLTPDQARFLRGALQQTENLARDARALADHRRGRYAIDHGPESSTPSPDGLGIRKVIFLLHHDALLSLHEGRGSDSLRACRAVLVAGRALGDEPSPAHQLLRLECWDEAILLLQRILAQRRPEDSELNDVQRLLETEASEPLAVLLLRGEMAFCHLRFSAVEAGRLSLFASRTSPPVARAFDWLARDAIKLPHAGALDYLAHRLALARQPIAAQASALRQWEKERSDNNLVGADIGAWRSGRLLKVVQNGQLRLRAAAAGVAAERYRARYGYWPNDLSALVPEFLSQVSEDPGVQAQLQCQRLFDGLLIHSGTRDARDVRRRTGPPTPAGSEVGFRLWNANLR